MAAPYGHGMRDTERLRIAKSYPHDPPDHSFLFAGGLALELVDPGDDPLANGRVRLEDRIVAVPDALARLGIGSVPGMAARTPVLAHGSNASPARLKDKYAASSPATVFPVIRAELDDYDVVYSAHFSRWGSIPSTLVPSMGTRVSVAITYLTDAQLARMHETEIGSGAVAGNYLYGLLREVRLVPRGLAPLAAIPAYLSRHGVLGATGAPLALAAIRALERGFSTATPVELLATVIADLAPNEAMDDFLLNVLDDADYRRACTERLRTGALPITVGGFAKLAP